MRHRPADAPTTFVPMSAVDERLGLVTRPEIKPYAEIRRGYTFFTEGDVLFAKITPCMQNGKHAVVHGLTDGIGFGSTEFHIVRPGPNVTSEWIHLYLRQPHVLSAATAHFYGAVGQQRVPKDFLVSLQIPVPPIAEQHRIVGAVTTQLSAVERARAAAEARLEAAAALPAAYLRIVFESPMAQRWTKIPLGRIGEVVSGVTLGRKINDKRTRTVPYLRVANVKDGYLDLSDVYEIEATEDEIKKCRLKQGDLLLTEGGDPDKLGRGTVWDEQIPECIHQNHIFRVRFPHNRLLPEFVSAQIGSSYGKAYFFRHAKQTTGIATINQKVLKALPLIVPPMEEQRRIVGDLNAQLTRAGNLREALQNELGALSALPAVLLGRAFAGQL